MSAGRALGITDEEIAEIVKLSVFIKEKAASHVEQLICAQVPEAAPKLKAAGESCC